MAKGDNVGGGYGKPPKKYQFQKGQSGNLKGRPKKTQSVTLLLTEAMSETVSVTEKDGGRRKLTKLQITIKQLANKAASGDYKSAVLVLNMLQLSESLNAASGVDSLVSEADKKILEGVVRRLAKGQENGHE